MTHAKFLRLSPIFLVVTIVIDKKKCKILYTFMGVIYVKHILLHLLFSKNIYKILSLLSHVYYALEISSVEGMFYESF